MAIEIFDLDGTLTDEFHPLWNLITEELAGEPEKFREEANAWKKSMLDDHNRSRDKRTASKEMTERGLQYFKAHNRNALAVQKAAEKIVVGLINKGSVRVNAIRYLSERLNANRTCIISTASYKDGAIGFVNALIHTELLSGEAGKKILFSGTEIDWATLQVTHMNVDHGKIESLERLFNKRIDDIEHNIEAVFGDDPQINDRALLELGRFAFVIPTSKNVDMRMPQNCLRADWDEIYRFQNDFQSLYQLKRSPAVAPQIKCIIFDLGGVIEKIDPLKVRTEFEKLGMLTAEEFFSLMRQSSACSDFETGKINRNEFLGHLQSLCTSRVTLDALESAWCANQLGVDESTVQAIQSLKDKGIKVAILSNTNPIHAEKIENNFYRRHGIRFREFFDEVVYSFEVGLRKPSAEIYSHVTGKLKLDPKSIVYIDDLSENLNAPRQLGLHCVLHKTNSELNTSLEKIFPSSPNPSILWSMVSFIKKHPFVSAIAGAALFCASNAIISSITQTKLKP